MELPQNFKTVSAAVADGGGGPLPDSVNGQDGGILERRREKGAGCVRQVMFRKQDLQIVPSDIFYGGQLVQDELLQHDLFFDPDRHGGPERRHSPGGKCVVRFQQPLEFQERLVIKHDGVDLRKGEAGMCKAVFDRIGRK